MALPRKLDESEIDQELLARPDWKRDGDAIERATTFPTFAQAIGVVDEIATIAEELNHHPDIDIRWRTVRLAMTTHDVGGLSTLDLEAADRFDACIRGAGGVTPA